MGKNILLIEKDMSLREFWEDVLKDEGFGVVSVSPELAKISGHGNIVPDMVFLGTGMDPATARSALKEMKKKNEKLLVISPTNAEELIEELRAVKMQGLDYKEHPIKVGNVRGAIREAIKIEELKAKYSFRNLVGKSAGMEKVFKAMSQVIKSPQTGVLILGETGTGKEEVAKAIHYNSARAGKPFVPISCTAVPETLTESELFGHEAGAFTDARSTAKGLLEMAGGGTIFLDEVGDMKTGLQAKLLRFLEERNFRRVGGRKDISVDVRVIAATNRDLEKMVEDGVFRKDLYYRLRVFPISIPPLRERKGDIPLLAAHFVNHFNTELKKDVKGLTFSAREKLIGYRWPGNVRELKNVIERAIILCRGEFITPRELILEAGGSGEVEELSLEANEKRLIKIALEKAEGNRTAAAKLLGITRFALRNRLKKYLNRDRHCF